jgi:hypothetical protein
MKQLLQFSPIFTPGVPNAGTLDFSALPGFSINKLYAVINVTRNTPLYIPGSPTYGLGTIGIGITGISGTLLTLASNTSAFSQSDVLEIFYDAAPGFDNATPYAVSNVSAERGGVLHAAADIQTQMLVELRVISHLLLQGMLAGINQGSPEDLDMLRQDYQNLIMQQRDTTLG